MSTRRIARFALILLVGAALGLAWSGAVSASPSAAGDGSGLATYQGRVIDLADGWQGAVSCVVFSAKDTRCFGSYQEADDLMGYSRETDPLYQRRARSAAGGAVAAVPSCGFGWLCLYQHIDGAGRRLNFSDEFWHQLADWGFNRQTSSWRNNQGGSDKGHLSLFNRSTVYDCAANTYTSQMGIYNDQAYAVWG